MNQHVTSTQHVISGLVILGVSAVSLLLGGYGLTLDHIGAVVGFNYGLVLVHAIETGNLEGSETISQYIGFGLYFTTFVLSGVAFLIYVSAFAVLSGLFTIGVGYLIGWAIYYR